MPIINVPPQAQAPAPLAPSLTLKSKALDGSRFEALEHLLRQSEVYAKFLAEQINMIETRDEEEQQQEVPTTTAAKTGKRGRSKAAAEAPAKKAKSGLTPTQVSCFTALLRPAQPSPNLQQQAKAKQRAREQPQITRVCMCVCVCASL